MPLTKVGKWATLYGIVAFEVAAITGVYYVWHNMNTDQEYRRKMHMKYPKVLEMFYQSCTLVGIHGVKEKDFQSWKEHK